MTEVANIIEKDGLEYVETDYAPPFGLGLNLPATRPLSFDTLASVQPLLSTDEIRKVIESEDWGFGEQVFDSSWVTNQNGYGSCAGYGGASALAKARVLEGQERVDLSGDYLYSLVNGGRDRGSMLDDNMRAILRNGVATAATVPLGGIYPSKYNKPVADKEAKRFRGHELYAVPDEQSMATALAMKMPVVIAIHVDRNWRRFDSRDVLHECNGPGNHCEHVDDIRYSTEKGRLEYRKATSHGRQYSGDGYCWTAWNLHYKTSARYHMFYAVPGAIRDPEGNNPPPIDGVEPPKPEPVDEVVIDMVTRSGCGWCDKWKNEVMPSAEDKGWTVNQTTGGGSVPRFTIRVGNRSKEQIGYFPFSELVSIVTNLYG